MIRSQTWTHPGTRIGAPRQAPIAKLTTKPKRKPVAAHMAHRVGLTIPARWLINGEWLDAGEIASRSGRTRKCVQSRIVYRERHAPSAHRVERGGVVTEYPGAELAWEFFA